MNESSLKVKKKRKEVSSFVCVTILFCLSQHLMASENSSRVVLGIIGQYIGRSGRLKES